MFVLIILLSVGMKDLIMHMKLFEWCQAHGKHTVKLAVIIQVDMV